MENINQSQYRCGKILTLEMLADVKRRIAEAGEPIPQDMSLQIYRYIWEHAMVKLADIVRIFGKDAEGVVYELSQLDLVRDAPYGIVPIERLR